MLKHIYFCYEEKPEEPIFDDECGVLAVVAESEDEALRVSNMRYCEKTSYDRDAEELPIGKVDLFEGLRRQIYGWVEGKCPNCDNPNQYAKLFYDEDTEKIYCEECEP